MATINYNQNSMDSLKGYLNKIINNSTMLGTENYLSGVDLSYWDENDAYVSSSCRSINEQISNIKSKVSSLLGTIISNERSYNSSTSNIKSEVSGLTSSVSISSGSSSGYTSSGSSYSTSSSAYTSSSSGESSESSVSVGVSSEGVKQMSKMDIDSLMLGLLAPFGVKKDNLGEITKSDEYDYIVSIKNPNEDGKWKPNDIKAYYVKDNQVVGVMTGNDTFIKVKDGSLVIENSKVESYSSMFVTGTGAIGTYLSTSSNYNTEKNKAIFKKFYPNSTDEDFNNFCSSIESKGKEYNAAIENVINNNKDKASDIIKNLAQNNLVIEGNAIKVDTNSLVTGLYAQQASKSGVDFSSAIGSDVTFSESTTSDIVKYLNDNYNLGINNNVSSNISGIAN